MSQGDEVCATHHIRTGVDQRGEVEGGDALVVPDVGVSARGQQQLDHLRVAAMEEGASNK